MGTSLIVLGLSLLKDAGLVTGGVAGLALLLINRFPLPVGVLLTCINIPFLMLAWKTMGRRFTVKTIGVNFAMAALSAAIPLFLRHSLVHPIFASLVGGSVIGMGALALARHGAGIGGFGVVALWLFRQRNWNAGLTLMILDGLALLASLPFISGERWVLSVVSALAINGVIFVWHRPGLYNGF